MFARLLWRSMRGSRGRIAVALVAVASGATVIAALLNLQFDMERQLTQQFRLLGANVVISHSRSAQMPDFREASSEVRGAPALIRSAPVLAEIERIPRADLVAAAPFLYLVARAADTPVVIAGTWLDQLPGLDPTWKIEGHWVRSRDEQDDCLVGSRVARQFSLSPGSRLSVQYLNRAAQLRVAGVIDAGGTEDSQVFINLPLAQKLARLDKDGEVELVQMSIRGTSATLNRLTEQLSLALPDYEVRPIQAVSQAEGNLLDRTRLLIGSMVVLILVLTALCVLATMAALAMERRKDVGLMKALGGSISRIVALFLAEVGMLGAVGGLIGSVLGIALSQWMGERVFGTVVLARWDIFPLTIALMVGVALAGALPLRLLGKVKPAVILRGE
jgi:putative ABC transport system permease protein